ncbi:MAG: hypothetical protein KAQ85_01685 [Thermodesulfovibrionia bacterium]|nr:hypothetical protein [Thermodesulfovibrionia bacterium]
MQRGRKITKALQEDVDRKTDIFLHYLRGYIMIAGGVEMSSEELLDMTLQEIFDSFYPNGIRFGVKYLKLKEEYSRYEGG